MSPKNKGDRPFSTNPRDRRIELRLTKDELEKLDWCCKHTGNTRSNVVRDGILKTYEILKNNNRNGSSDQERSHSCTQQTT